MKRSKPSSGGLREINAKEVKVSVVFTRLNEIDTMNEKFSCEASIFASWVDYPNDLVKSQDEEDAYFWDPENHWDPQLYIDNAIGEIKEKDVKYNFERYFDKDREEYFVEVNMIKRIQGVFFEKLELYHFPFDVQDLSLTITSHRPTTEIYIIHDAENPSKVNKHASLDKHIWKLHEHVNIKIHTITNDFHINHGSFDNAIYSHSAITIQCRVARKPGYYVVNCLLPTLMITLCVFFTFLMSYERLAYRFSLLFTTILTSITFRWSIHGRVLPTVSYLTFLDMYCISSILVVFTCMIWHAIFAIIYERNEQMALVCDRYATWVFVFIVIIMHIQQTFWFILAFRKRNELHELDKTAAVDNYKRRQSGISHVTSCPSMRNNSRVFIANENGSYNYENTINSISRMPKVYHSYSKLQNSNMTIFRLKNKDKINIGSELSNYITVKTTSDDSRHNKEENNNIIEKVVFISECLDNFGNTIKNSNPSSDCSPLIQQSSNDSKDCV